MSALLGGGPGNAQGMSDFVAHMMEDPGMRETMINMISQPGILDMIAGNNPQLQQMMNAMPGVRETMQNPEVLRMMLSPQMMRMATQMAQQGGMVIGEMLVFNSFFAAAAALWANKHCCSYQTECKCSSELGGLIPRVCYISCSTED